MLTHGSRVERYAPEPALARSPPPSPRFELLPKLISSKHRSPAVRKDGMALYCSTTVPLILGDGMMDNALHDAAQGALRTHTRPSHTQAHKDKQENEEGDRWRFAAHPGSGGGRATAARPLRVVRFDRVLHLREGLTCRTTPISAAATTGCDASTPSRTRPRPITITRAERPRDGRCGT